MREHYTIDLKTSKKEIRIYPIEMIRDDLKLLGLKKPMDLDLCNDFNTKIFKTEDDAEAWLRKFEHAKSWLTSNAKAESLPKMLCKQRYIILSHLGEKTFTRRRALKKWKSGQKFQLYDQKIFLTVILKKITDTKDGLFTYEFEAIK